MSTRVKKVISKKDTDASKNALSNTETSYLKLGDTVYTLNKVSESGIDIEQELREYYGKRFDSLSDELGEGIVSELQQDREAYFQHLNKYRNRGQIAVPPDKFNKLLVAHGSELIECRVITYAPNESSIDSNTLRNCLSTAKADELGIPQERNAQYLVSHKPLFSVPLVVGIGLRSKYLYTPLLQTFHTFTGGRVCTGHHSGEDFWRLDDAALEREMNRINWFSPACHSVRIGDNVFNLTSLVTDDTVTNVRERGSEQWRT